MPAVLERSVIEPKVANKFIDIEKIHTQYILDALAEAEEYAARPDAKWYTWEEVRGMIRERHGI